MNENYLLNDFCIRMLHLLLFFNVNYNCGSAREKYVTLFQVIYYNKHDQAGMQRSGRALDSHVIGHGFKSRHMQCCIS